MDQSPARAAVPAAVPEITGDGAHQMGEEGDLHAYSSFDGALRGYDRRQVNKYVTRTQQRLDELTAEAATARRNEQILAARVDELSKTMSMCTCDPNKPESAVVGARLRQIIEIATAEADDLRTRAETESKAMREEAGNVLAEARQQADQASSALEAMLAHRRAAEEAASAERRAAIEGWSERHVTEARETARRVIERAAAVSGQVIASARWLVDALGAHRDALSEQLGGVQRRIDELPSLEAAAAVPGEHLATVPAEELSAAERANRDLARHHRPDQSNQPVRAVVRVPTMAAVDEAPPGQRPEGLGGPGSQTAPPAGSTAVVPSGNAAALPPGNAAVPADTATLNRTWAPVNPRIGGAHRG